MLFQFVTPFLIACYRKLCLYRLIRLFATRLIIDIVLLLLLIVIML